MRTRLQVVCLLFLSFASLSVARCRSARPDEVPINAHILTILSEGPVLKIAGTVIITDDQPARGAVVEIYRHHGEETNEAYDQTVKTQRVKACVTDASGKFSFSGLKPGKYLVRVGTRDRGMNQTDVFVEIDPRSARRDLRIHLHVGT